MMLPKPWQSGHAPNGLLNENSRGCGSSYGMPHSRHSNRSLNRSVTASAIRALRRELNRKRRPAAFGVGGLDRVGQARAKIAFDLHAIDDHLERRAILQRRGVDVLERDRPAVEIQPAEPFAPQRGERFGDGIDQIRQIRLRANRRRLLPRRSASSSSGSGAGVQRPARSRPACRSR